MELKETATIRHSSLTQLNDKSHTDDDLSMKVIKLSWETF
jgi:hypothetical protein